MRLTSVALVGGADGTVPPTVGVASVAEVTITSNDSPRGTLTFLQESYLVQEDTGAVDIVIAREQGTIGRVSVVYFVGNLQAMNGQDFMVEPVDAVVFETGQASAILTILINNDSEPEIEEQFCVGLRLPRDGAILGNITASKLVHVCTTTPQSSTLQFWGTQVGAYMTVCIQHDSSNCKLILIYTHSMCHHPSK